MSQKLNESSKTSTVDLTGDGNWLLVVNKYGSAFVYQRESNSFKLLQELSVIDGSHDSHTGALTDDHPWLVFGKTYKIYIYKFDG